MKKILFSLILLSSCGQPQVNSESKWAHTPSERAWGTIPALLQYPQQGKANNFSTLRVCVQGNSNFTGKALLLETQLAYAAWLSAAFDDAEPYWTRLKFELNGSCLRTDPQWASIVRIESLETAADEGFNEQSFAAATLSCQKSGLQSRCGSQSTVFGWGGPAAIGYSYRADPNRWESVTLRSAASVRLSPFVKWISLADDLSAQTLMPAERKAALLQRYQELLGRVEALSMGELSSLHQELEAANAVAVDDSEFKRLTNDFFNSSQPTLTTPYVPVATGFHVLLHEVGHQFGMDHADNPSQDSETGRVVSGELKNNRWITSEAAMAYGKPYLYLTADDKAGVKSLADKTRLSIATRF